MTPIFNILKGIFSVTIAIFLTISTFFSGEVTQINKEIASQESLPQKQIITETENKIPTENSGQNRPKKKIEAAQKQEKTVSQASVKKSNAIPKIEKTKVLQATNFSTADNRNARSAVVNIFCETKKERSIQTVTGSGVIINKQGVVLTNAHIAQYFLLSDYPKKGATKCSIRTGNPARDTYKASLLYIPITWIQANANSLTLKNPSGTGKEDYALLYITKSTKKDTLVPSSFPYIQVDTYEEVVKEKDPVLVVSYPAIIAESQAVKNNLYLVSTETSVENLFTFGENFLDIFGVLGNIAAQRGSSGGAMINKNGLLVGLIVTSTSNALILNRELRALTPAYINRNLIKENGTTLGQLVAGNLLLRSQAFNLTTAPLLTKLLLSTITKESK